MRHRLPRNRNQPFAVATETCLLGRPGKIYYLSLLVNAYSRVMDRGRELRHQWKCEIGSVEKFQLW
jgi:hypothetical protein